ncbi:MAG: VIT domain-containing protein [Gemmatimonadales bacterium]|jgi:Ca-activated chloride channel family protein
MFRRLALAAALAALAAPSLRAQGWIQPPIARIGPSPIIRVSSTVRTRIDGRVARVEVEEQFRNAGATLAEGSYLYPMPGEAVFTDFSLWMGETQVRGEMMSADQARGIYEEIVRRVRDPALLTLEGHGMIRARVFPIPPGETRRVVLRYTQVLQRAGDALRLRYAIGSRPFTGGHGYLDQPEGVPTDAFRYTVTVPGADAYGTPYSPTHAVTSRRVGRDLEITLDPGASGDVEIFVPLRRGLVGTSVVTSAPAGEDGYFMLLIAPPASTDAAVVPRDLAFVLDVSGSMSGEKIEQAKAALRQALATLGRSDRFKLVAFSTRVVPFRANYVAATPENVQAAREFVDRLVADGGTNIAGALDAVLGASADQSERLPVVVFVTDGNPTVGEQAPDRIAADAAARIGRARIFTVGVGFDVNTYLLDRLASEGHGSAEYVAPDANIETAMGELLGKIQHPALVNLRIAGTPVTLAQTYPAGLPDLFYGEELVVFGRYRGAGAGPVVVTGERNGRTERFTADAVFPAAGSGASGAEAGDFVPRLWASRRIGDLTRQIRLEGASPSLVEEVRDLGLRYGILTEYTSYLVQEPMTAWNRPLPMPMAPALRGGAGSAGLQTGRDAFDRAQASAAMSGASNLAAADHAAKARMDELAVGGVAGGAARAVRRAGGRLFVRTDSGWTDAAHRDSLKVVVVAPYSDAYFALARALPEIAPCLGVGDDLLIAGRRASIRITASGRSAWRPGELEQLVRAFRGA